MKKILILLTAVCSISIAQKLPDIKKLDPVKFEREGSGGKSGTFPGFTEVDSQKLERAIALALSLVQELNIESDYELKMLWNLENEISSSKYIKIKNQTAARANRFPGDYNWGGLLAASTKPYPGSPTYIYPGFLESNEIDETQVAQMVIEEALHRTLPEPTNRYERVVKSITGIITTNSGDKTNSLKAYLNKIKNLRLPWAVSYSIISHPYTPTSIYSKGYLSRIKTQLQGSGRVTESSASTRLKIVLNIPENTLEIHDLYSKTVQSINAPYPGFLGNPSNVRNLNYNGLISGVLQEIKRIEFMQSL